jgi:hypothetical protein
MEDPEDVLDIFPVEFLTLAGILKERTLHSTLTSLMLQIAKL